jgi:PHP family Zn ribbon phosphoesterase
MSLPDLLFWAPRKGLDLLGTGDFIHTNWLEELNDLLEADESGLLKPKDGSSTRFLLTAEVKAVFEVEHRMAETHLLITAPHFEAARRLRSQLTPLKVSNGETTPGFRMFPAELVERILVASPESCAIPCHIWTPSSAVYASKSGFSKLRDCFGGMSAEIFALETGLSCDPGMCWRIRDLDGKSLLSFSGASTPRGLGREFTFFDGELSYRGVTQALRGCPGTSIKGTVELVSELGRHFFNGHRGCQIAKSPIETHFEGRRCPACRRALTIGSFQRTLEIADRAPEDLKIAEDRGWIRSRRINSPPFRRMVPLQDIIAATYGIRGRQSQTVDRLYECALSAGLSERQILLDLNETELEPLVGHDISEGILRVREGFFRISPGYDGVAGQLDIFEDAQTAELVQMKLF